MAGAAWECKCQTQHVENIARCCWPCCQRTMRGCWAWPERAEWRYREPWHYLALPRSPIRRRTPRQRPPRRACPAPAAPAPAAPAPAGICGRAGAARAGGVPTGTQGRGQRRNPRARRLQIILVVLDERCSMVCRTRTATWWSSDAISGWVSFAGLNLTGQPDKLMTWIGHG